MKKILLSLAGAVIGLTAMAQNFTVTGSIIDANSNPVTNQAVYIYTDSNFFNYYNVVYSDMSGNFSDVIINGAQTGPNIDYYVSTNDNCNPNNWITVTLSNNQGATTSGTAAFSTCASAACNASYVYTDSANTGYLYFYNTSTGSNLTYSWDFGDGNTSTLQNPWHQYNPGAYYMCLTVTNGNCTNTTCDSIWIGNSTPNCTASFFATNNNQGTYNFTDMSSMNPTSWFWDFGDGNTSTQQNPVHTFSSTGTYVVCLTASNFMCSDTYCYTINYTGTCQAEFYSYEDSINNVIYLVDLSSGNGAMTYFWDFGDGNTSTLQYPTHVYGNSGFYMVCLTITDNNFCSSTYCDSLGFTLFGGPNSHQNGFTINVIPASSVGVEEIAETIKDINVYPNPTNENASLEYNAMTAGNHTISIVDIAGKLVFATNYAAQKGMNRIPVNASQIEAGVYMIVISDDNGNKNQIRLIKE